MDHRKVKNGIAKKYSSFTKILFKKNKNRETNSL